MANQHVTSEPSTNLADDGSWMFFPEAMSVTGLSERSLRRYMQLKQIKYRKLGKSANARVQLWITNEHRHLKSKDTAEDRINADTIELAATDFVTDESWEEVEEVPQGPERKSHSDISSEIETILRAITQQFTEKLDEHKDMIVELRHQLAEKETQLKLLPDLEKIARDKEEAAKLKEFESEALKKQVQLLEQAKEESEESAKAAEAAKAALQVDVEALKKELEQLKKPWWKKMFEAPPAESK